MLPGVTPKGVISPSFIVCILFTILGIPPPAITVPKNIAIVAIVIITPCIVSDNVTALNPPITVCTITVIPNALSAIL